MVCRFLDSFDYYVGADYLRKWTTSFGTIGITTTNQRTGTQAMEWNSAVNNITRTFDDQASWVMGFGLKRSGNGTQALVRFLDVSTTQCSLLLNLDGTVSIVRGTATAVAGGKSTFSMKIKRYYHIEVKVTIANSIGANTAVVRINEKIVLTVDAGEDLQSTANATADIIRIDGLSSQETNIDDLYVFDGTDGGGTEPTNDDFAGDMKIGAHWPSGNGATSDFLGSDVDSVDNYLLVDEALTDDDTTYVESSTIGHIDLYAFDDLAETPIEIKAIQINSVVRKDDAGAKTVRAVIRPTSTNFVGDSKSPQDGVYSNEIEILNEDPETEAAWTEAGFNATEFGLEIVS